MSEQPSLVGRLLGTSSNAGEDGGADGRRRLLRSVLGLLAVVAVVAVAGVRLLPHDLEEWHVNPVAAEAPSGDNWSRIGPGLEKEAPVFVASSTELSSALHDIALSDPRTEVLADDRDSSGEGLITYVQRSRVFGFPDYITASVESVGDGSQSTVTIFSRARFGRSDFGVNQERVERWVERLALTLPSVS